MPITATLSRQFYEKFGDEVTNELVAWLNAVDESYRQEFRDLFAANFGQVRAEMTALRSDMAAMEARLVAHTDRSIAELRAEILVGFAGQMGQQRSEFTGQMAEHRSALDRKKSELTAELAAAERRILRWAIGLWLVTVPGLAGIFVGLQKLGWL